MYRRPRGSTMRPSIGPLTLDLRTDAVGHTNRQGCAGAEFGWLSISRHGPTGTTAGAGRGTDRRPLATANDGAEDRAADGRATDLGGAASRRRLAVAIDCFGWQPHLGPVSQDERVEPDTHARTLPDPSTLL